MFYRLVVTQYPSTLELLIQLSMGQTLQVHVKVFFFFSSQICFKKSDFTPLCRCDLQLALNSACSPPTMCNQTVTVLGNKSTPSFFSPSCIEAKPQHTGESAKAHLYFILSLALWSIHRGGGEGCWARVKRVICKQSCCKGQWFTVLPTQQGSPLTTVFPL